MQPNPGDATGVRSLSDNEPPCPSEPRDPRYGGVPPLVEEAQQAFDRDLPQLLKERPGQWVAYHGSTRVGFAKTKTELYQECYRQGIDEEEFLVLCIEEGVNVMIFYGL